MARADQPLTSGLLKEPDAEEQSAAKRKRATDRLRYLSHYDALTTLPNRSFFRRQLEKALSHAQHYNHTFAVLFLSLDPYERINETLGPAMSDRLVRCVAKRLKNIVTHTDALGYWGNDEFVLILDHPADKAHVSQIVQILKKGIERRLFSYKQEFFLTSSIGIALYPSNGCSVETLLKCAAAALLQVKEGGGNGYQFYAAEMNARSLKRFTLENSLCRGLPRKEFTLHYQPQVHTSSRVIVGAEALIRWDHPQLGAIPPSDFIPLAEKSGLIVPIGEWVLRAACLQLKKWQATGFPKLKLAINVSARQLQEQAPADTIVQILEETRLSPGCLELELTESSLMANSQHVVKTLVRLKEIGVKLAIDDFGTGFSSLEYLRRLPLDILKIDRSFVRDSSNVDGAALVSSIITLAHKLRLRVVAEGVETDRQWTFLQRLGCEYMQGYLFGKPLPGEQFKQILARADHKFAEPNNSSGGQCT
ncbi:MAG: putative bifunctional diguanylate cyclase/phosphodiesterase [Pyrinomonadaceae bacterium]